MPGAPDRHAAWALLGGWSGWSGPLLAARLDHWADLLCILTAVLVTGSDLLSLSPPQPGGPQQNPGLFVSISQVNLCTNTLLLEAIGGTVDFSLHLAGDLSSAAVTASQVAFFDQETNTSFFVDIAVTWAATGSTTRSAGTSHFRTPGLVMQAVEVGFTRDAVATGTITSGPTNYIPTPSSLVEVQHDSSGTIAFTLGAP